MEQTEYYGLKLPGENDYADVAVLNENAGTVDAALHGLETGKAGLDPETGRLVPEQAPTAGEIMTAEGQSVEAALSNKANVADHQLKTYTSLAQLSLSGAVTMEQIIEAMPVSGSASIASNSTTANYIADTPITSRYWHVTIDKNSSNYVTCHAMRVDGGELMYVGRYHTTTTPKFQGWIPEPTATPPQELPLPLEAGFTAYATCVYWRTQDGEVKTNNSLEFNNGVAYGQHAATFPPGYRPMTSKMVQIVAILSDNITIIHGHALADIDGTIKLYPYAPITGPGIVVINPFVFVAA